MSGWASELVSVAVVVLLLAAAWTDVASRIIPDTISIALAAVGLAARLVTGLPDAAISLAAAVLLFVLLALAHARGMLGGGDVKLAAAVAIGLPAELIYHFIVMTALAGGVVALLHLALRVALRGLPPHVPRRGASLARRVLSAEHWRIVRHGSIPYGVAIAFGGIWAVLTGRGG